MSYLEMYRNRILANGTKSTDTIMNASKQTVKNNLSNSLFSETVLINGIEYIGLVTQGKTSDDRKLLFEPDTKVDIGSVVLLNNNSYLIMDFQGEGINEIYPSATLKLCNSTFPIKANKTRVLLGQYDNGKKEWGDSYEIDRDEPCIVEMGTVTTNTNTQLVIPKNSIYITLKNQQSDTITIDYEFTMYNNKYKIIDIDQTKVIGGKGIIKILAERA